MAVVSAEDIGKVLDLPYLLIGVTLPMASVIY